MYKITINKDTPLSEVKEKIMALDITKEGKTLPPEEEDQILPTEDDDANPTPVQKYIKRLVPLLIDKATATQECNYDIKRLLDEAKQCGLNPKVLRAVAMKKLKLEEMDEEKRAEYDDAERTFVSYSQDAAVPTQLDLFK